ncbi:hypothetical protein P152DRAFT_120181 [Eremomyces bilateralis CBS 781.70]|uniref:Uncharacterized protein n=1 Tax=Eremomyces bilateralis CBS 781.70 TaxID=1392243 RepID=A0A6G1GEK8_9PEZI|nr:uncharacterized protein P152DRAFT_120181 [Eremomyces bilateralis CBS 781.70]KAF1816346.1 hypothetical protein P152DRAFT_120181 [Eremomyces bilateralis CBS 781.70]
MPKLEYKWFISGEGISREVIQADICRYLGNDALVKPGYGTGENEVSLRTVASVTSRKQIADSISKGVYGYWIAAYRALTTEMTSDLKTDSTRWSQEQARSRDPRAAYEDSQVHQSRQYWGPTAPGSSAPSGYTPTGGASSSHQGSTGHNYSGGSTYPQAGQAGRQGQYAQAASYSHQAPAYTTTSSSQASYPAQAGYPAYPPQGASQQDPYAATQNYPGYPPQQPYQPADPRNPQNPYGYPPREGAASGSNQAGAYPYPQQGGYPQSQRPGQSAPGFDQYGRPINPNQYGR